jgi:hypothetical protein
LIQVKPASSARISFSRGCLLFCPNHRPTEFIVSIPQAAAVSFPCHEALLVASFDPA